MTKVLPVEVIPHGSDDPMSVDYNLDKSMSCAATVYRDAIDWKKSALDIKWNSSEKFFSVEFNGAGDFDVPIGELLSKRIPLKIATSSRCECGSTLKLGDYSISMDGSDFKFHADYFVPICKKKLVAEKTGIKRILQTWFTGLKKIEIKATGVGIERS